tara:strand:+ start:1885 stop:2037 length:153 start_codon:yes stop_codon:yes gene_type:complete
VKSRSLAGAQTKFRGDPGPDREVQAFLAAAVHSVAAFFVHMGEATGANRE